MICPVFNSDYFKKNFFDIKTQFLAKDYFKLRYNID